MTRAQQLVTQIRNWMKWGGGPTHFLELVCAELARLDARVAELEGQAPQHRRTESRDVRQAA